MTRTKEQAMEQELDKLLQGRWKHSVTKVTYPVGDDGFRYVITVHSFKDPNDPLINVIGGVIGASVANAANLFAEQLELHGMQFDFTAATAARTKVELVDNESLVQITFGDLSLKLEGHDAAILAGNLMRATDAFYLQRRALRFTVGERVYTLRSALDGTYVKRFGTLLKIGRGDFDVMFDDDQENGYRIFQTHLYRA